MEHKLKANVDVALLKQLCPPKPITTPPVPNKKQLVNAIYALEKISENTNRHSLKIANKQLMPIVSEAMRVIELSLDMVNRINRLREALIRVESDVPLAEALDRRIAFACQRNVVEIAFLTAVFPILWTASGMRPFLPPRHPFTRALPSRAELQKKMERLKAEWQAVLLQTCE